MPYDKTQVSGSDRRIFAEQDDEVSDLAQKYGLSQAQIRELISRVGNDRKKLDQAFDLYLFNML
jgi:Mor family transcriptional regulator